MGLPLATLFADAGANVTGADISPRVVESINKGINHIKEEPGLSELVEKRIRRTPEGDNRPRRRSRGIRHKDNTRPNAHKKPQTRLTPVYDASKEIEKACPRRHSHNRMHNAARIH